MQKDSERPQKDVEFQPQSVPISSFPLVLSACAAKILAARIGIHIYPKLYVHVYICVYIYV